MILKSIQAQNFLSFKDLNLNLENRGLLLLNGENLDNPALNNNGAGKSSILEAVVYALYGRTLRGLKGDSVIHRKVGKDTKVFLDLIDDTGARYRIARYRKHNVNKNKSLLYRDDKDITPKSEADFEKYISELLQADYNTFTASLLYSAESFKFATATDSEIKKTFDTMLGLDILSKSLEITRQRLSNLTGEKNKILTALTLKKSELVKLEEKLEQLVKSRDSFESEQSQKIEMAQQSLQVLKEKAVELEEELQWLVQRKNLRENQLEKAEAELNNKKDDLKSIEQLKSELQKVKEEINATNFQINCENNQVTYHTNELKKFKEQILKKQKQVDELYKSQNDLSSQIGKPCSLCGQILTESAIEVTRKEFDNKIKIAEEELDDLIVKPQVAEECIKKTRDKILELSKKLSELTETKDEFENLLVSYKNLEQKKDDAENTVKKIQNNLHQMETSIRVKETEIHENSNLIEMISEQINALTNSKLENPFNKLIHSVKQEKIQLSDMINNYEKKLDNFKEDEKNLKFWETAFSNQGIKSYILDDITPFLNRRLNKYLSKLTSGQIEAVFSTQSTLKSGEQREKFNLSIVNNSGGEQYNANSGGEKKRIDLAINLALQDLIASRSTKKLNIAMFDEVFDSLDENGVDGVVSLLQELAQEKSTILVVSHNEYFKSFFTNVLTVVKKDGFSSLENML